jgi:hypothetical protein
LEFLATVSAVLVPNGFGGSAGALRGSLVEKSAVKTTVHIRAAFHASLRFSRLTTGGAFPGFSASVAIFHKRIPNVKFKTWYGRKLVKKVVGQISVGNFIITIGPKNVFRVH